MVVHLQLASTLTMLPPRSRFSLVTSISLPSPALHRIVATSISDQHIVRRSANYQPALWDSNYIQSMKSEYGGDSCIGRVNELKAKVRVMLDKMMGPLDQLELIDILQRLGLSYHFEDEIKRILKTIYSTICKMQMLQWADLCKSYLLEARWYHSGYKPALQEYMDNAWISISGPVNLMHAYFLVSNPITKEALECLHHYPNIVRWSSMIFRLADDLGTSSDELKRGDVPKSIQCHMYETGASEEEAREHIRHLISETWKKMNKDGVVAADSAFSETFIGSAMNLARTAQFMFQHGDGVGIQDRETKDRVLSLIVQPIPVAF